MYEDGSQVEPPIATCEEQGFVYASKLQFAEVLWWMDKKDEARQLYREARELKKRFNEVFWIEPEGFFAMGLDSKGEQIRAIASNPGLVFLSTIGDRLSESYEQLSILSFDKRMERLVLILLKLADELGVPSPEGIQLSHYFQQEELAEMIAGRREVVSSLLNQLRKMGLIHYSRRQRIRSIEKPCRTIFARFASKQSE